MVDECEQPIDTAIRLAREVTGVTLTGETGWAPIHHLPPIIHDGTVYLNYGTLLPIEIAPHDGFSWRPYSEIAHDAIEQSLIPPIMSATT